MLRKLFKYDFLAIGKTMWLLTLIAVLVTIAGTVSGYFIDDVFEKFIIDEYVNFVYMALMFLLGTIIFISFIAITAYFVLSTVIIMKRYYQNLFTDEGYLTFTLPVKTSAILDAKVLSGLLWGAIASIVSIISLIFLIYALVGENIADVLDEFKMAVEYISGSIEIPTYHYVLFIVEYVLSIIVNFVFGMLLLYFCITLATVIVKKARVLLGVGFYIGVTSVLSALSQIVSTISSIFLGSQTVATPSEAMAETAVQMHIQMWFGIILYGGVAIASYILNRYLLKNKLNLV